MPFLHKHLQRIKQWVGTSGVKKAEKQGSHELPQEKPPTPVISHSALSSTPSSLSPEDKISLFMSLFHGRRDVFPKRWDNQKTGKSGYSPACHNEWVRGICKKPKIKCSDCPSQAFIPVTEHSYPQTLHWRKNGRL